MRLLRETASGPVSAVFLGEQETRVGVRRVAVKLLRELPDGGVERLFTLRDRSRRIASLGHRHLVCTLDVARVDERFALVSPWVDGIDLLDWVDVLSETDRILPRRVTCDILRGVSVALGAVLHASPPGTDAPLGMSHRDLKPSNVLVTRDGELKVTDVGTGYTSLSGRQARSGALKKGLVRYLSPERRDGHRPMEASDVYALGILSLELFRGRWLRRLRSSNPAHDRYLAEVVARIEDLQQRSDADDRMLRNLLLRMVAHDPEARPGLAEVASTFRTLTDRVTGPTLESFASAHAVPWLEDPPSTPDARVEGARAFLFERGDPVPAPSRDGLAVVTLPDRYDLHLESSQATGEYVVEVGHEVTDPRLRLARSDTPTPPVARNVSNLAAHLGEPIVHEEVTGPTVEPVEAPTPVPRQRRGPTPRGGGPERMARPPTSTTPSAAPVTVPVAVPWSEDDDLVMSEPIAPPDTLSRRIAVPEEPAEPEAAGLPIVLWLVAGAVLLMLAGTALVGGVLAAWALVG